MDALKIKKRFIACVEYKFYDYNWKKNDFVKHCDLEGEFDVDNEKSLDYMMEYIIGKDNELKKECFEGIIELYDL
jgi:hypothetical protein